MEKQENFQILHKKSVFDYLFFYKELLSAKWLYGISGGEGKYTVFRFHMHIFLKDVIYKLIHIKIILLNYYI